MSDSKNSAIEMPKIIAHRGASGDAPENTLAAIKMAADHGATWIEIDVNISRDAVPVLFHDDGLSRCSNGKGLVIEHTLTSLQSLDAGAWFSDKFTGERIATLDECLALALETTKQHYRQLWSRVSATLRCCRRPGCYQTYQGLVYIWSHHRTGKH